MLKRALAFQKGKIVATTKEIQARLLDEVYQPAARKKKLEDDLRNFDAVDRSLQETAAMREIEAYRSQLPNKPPSA